MKDAKKTIGEMIDKASSTILSSVDENGFPNTKTMLPQRKRNGIEDIYLTTNTWFTISRIGSVKFTQTTQGFNFVFGYRFGGSDR
jgi:general stress protein 26